MLIESDAAGAPAGKPAELTASGEFSVSTELERRNIWLIELRWMAAAGVIVTAVAVHALALSDLNIFPILAVGAGLLLYNAALLIAARRLLSTPVKAPGNFGPLARLLVPRTFVGLGDEDRVAKAAFFAFLQITVDFLFLAVLLHYCGGIDSPFAVFFVFHVVLASILLSRRATYVEAGLGFLLFGAVVFGEYYGILQHHPIGPLWPVEAYRSWEVAATGLAVLGATLFLASYMCSTIAVDLREGVRANVCLSRQIAEDKRQLAIAYEKLRHSDRTKSQYMRKVAHELRGPLGTIETALKVLLQGMAGELDEPSRELIGRAQRRAGELAAVTHDLLLLARARETGVQEQRVRIALGDLIADVIRDYRETADRKQVQLSAGTPSEGSIMGDPAAIRQLIANLVENAIRYTGPGGSVFVTLRAQGDRLVVAVDDTGIGISADDLPKIFDDFYRGAQAREHASNGTGLGLAIVKEIAEHHGAKIAVKSSLGQGSRFEVSLPAASDSEQAQAQTA